MDYLSPNSFSLGLSGGHKRIYKLDMESSIRSLSVQRSVSILLLIVRYLLQKKYSIKSMHGILAPLEYHHEIFVKLNY